MSIETTVRIIFEQLQEGIINSNLDTQELDLPVVIGSLVHGYLAEGNLSLAFKAAKISENTELLRLVFNASKTPSLGKEHPGGLIETVREQHLELQILFAAGTDQELREAALALQEHGYSRLQDIIRIYTHINDADALVRLGTSLIDKYFATFEEERHGQTFSGSTRSIPRSTLEVLSAAKKLKAKGINRILIQFARRLLNEHNSKYSVLANRHDERENIPEVIQAYELAGTKDSLRRAARGYINIGKFDAAARCYGKICDFDGVKRMVETIVRQGNLSDAIQLRAKIVKKPIPADELYHLVEVAIGTAKDNVVTTITKYLNDHNNDWPFPTECTFWHFSERNDEWKRYLCTVDGMAGRVDTYYSKSYPSIAKELYCTDQAPVIARIHKVLQIHLLVGYLLSAVTMETRSYGPRHDRKYQHPFDAVMRTFGYAFIGEGYNPFDTVLHLDKEDIISGLWETMKTFQNKEHALMVDDDGLSHTAGSHEFLHESSRELQCTVREVYQQLAADIRQLLEQLK